MSLNFAKTIYNRKKNLIICLEIKMFPHILKYRLTVNIPISVMWSAQCLTEMYFLQLHCTPVALYIQTTSKRGTFENTHSQC